MEFVGQIHLDPSVFPVLQPTMVYLFVADDGEESYDAYGGFNAVVVQPGDLPRLETVALEEGPASCRLVSAEGAIVPAHPADCEFEVDTLRAVDGQAPTKEQRRRWAEDPGLEYVERLQGALGSTRGNKIGGIPYFHRDWPDPFTPAEWQLVLQVEDGHQGVDLPFFLNLGTDGIGYVLVSTDFRSGVFFWERPG